jgi:hypothetical protein
VGQIAPGFLFFGYPFPIVCWGQELHASPRSDGRLEIRQSILGGHPVKVGVSALASDGNLDQFQLFQLVGNHADALDPHASILELPV